MKKLLFAALIAVTMGTSAFAASPAKLFSATETTFKADFKNATDVSWTAGADFAKATFVLNNVKMEAFYNNAGELIGTSKGITLEELPVGAKRSFAKKFAGYDVKEAIRFEGADEAAYYISAIGEKGSVIIKIGDNSQMTVIKRS
ncbi:MAG TPA: hypothetical protein VF610_08250 [Segetibacter sp.]|jgi:hypothetical protein